MKKIIGFGLVVLFCAVLVLPVAAQDAVRLQNLRVGLWPEFDDPSLLVIYWGEIASDVTFPAVVSLRIPASVEAPHVVAAQVDESGGIAEVAYENTVDGEWRVITFEAGGPNFQFEYYAPLNKTDQTRTAGYTWLGDYAIDQLAIELQQPPHSEGMTTTPALTDSGVNANDNLIYYGGQFGPLAAGESFSLLIEYTRDTDDFTASLLNAMQTQSESVSSGASVMSSTPTQQSTGGMDVIILVVVAVVFFLLGAAAMRVAINIQTLNK